MGKVGSIKTDIGIVTGIRDIDEIWSATDARWGAVSYVAEHVLRTGWIKQNEIFRATNFYRRSTLTLANATAFLCEPNEDAVLITETGNSQQPSAEWSRLRDRLTTR